MAHWNSSPAAYPLNIPDSDAITAMANWSPRKAWYPAHCKSPEGLVKKAPSKSPSSITELQISAPTCTVIFASVTVKSKSWAFINVKEKNENNATNIIFRIDNCFFIATNYFNF